MPTIDLAVLARRVAWAFVVLAVVAASFAAGNAVAASRDSVRSQSVRSLHKAGTSVRELQRALGIPADGIYGRRTRRAVRRFQRAHGLHVDGIAGSATLAALGITAHKASNQDPAVVLERIAQCESGGDPTAVSAGGTYRGKYQFSRETWRELGGSGDPAGAPEAEQDRMAAKLYAQRGASPWPVCGA